MRITTTGIALLAGTAWLGLGCGPEEPSRVARAAREIAVALGLPRPVPAREAPSPRPGALEAEAEPPNAAPGDPTAGAPTSLPERPAPGGPSRVYYQFTDAAGTVRFVTDLAQVPPEQRSRAGRIELDAPPPSVRPARAPGPRPFSTQPAPPPHPLEVTVYTAPWCGWCRRTLAYLDGRGVAYDNKDIEANPAHRRELLEKTGQTAIPVVEIDGQRIVGYSPRRMEQLLAQARPPGS